MIELRRSEDRGPANHGWLQSKHTFSFGSYYDPEHMGVSVLRVINDDRVAPGNGFATHSHQDMEIISYVKKGVIEHKDSMGNIERLPVGEFQLMTAGTGVTHSEYNPSTSDSLEFLQIWIEPNQYGIEPGYQQKCFETTQGLQKVISPTGDNGTLKVHQDVSVYKMLLEPESTASLELAEGRTVYIHVVSGKLTANGQTLSEGDGAAIKSDAAAVFVGIETSEALVFDLP